MPRVGGNGPLRRPMGGPGPVLSNHSSDDEFAAGGPPASAWARGAPKTGADQAESDQASSALFEGYLQAGRVLGDDLGKDQVFQQGLSRIRDHLANMDGSCCLICLNHIRPTEAIWHCGRGCYTVLHLVCIQDWARSQLDAAAAKAAARLSQFPAAADEARATAEWGCPKCRSTYPAADIPRQYKCFCEKVENPEFDPWVTPHSCGEICGRPLPGGCEHTCLLLCHPGPCPPCPLVVDASCYCGRKQHKRRCGHHEYSCEGVCGAQLECGHRCPDMCHPGDCASCRVMGDFACRCGAERRRRPCGERAYQCGRVCGKALSCGNHTCEQVCHAGPCGECPFSGARSCPCGKVTHEGMSCTDKVPTCGATCGKLLPCGVHRCNDRCHHGECTTQCRGPALKTCRCGKSQKEVLCFQEHTCERRCMAMRACGRHPCKRRCCDGNCPPCEELPPHRCHFGPCPPCPKPCATPLTCGHACAEPSCHDPPPPAVPDFVQPPPPKAKAAGSAATSERSRAKRDGGGSGGADGLDGAPAVWQPSILAAQMLAGVAATGELPSACPPCRQPVPLGCVGGHTQRALPCCEVRPFSCGAACGRPLACGNHTCGMPCHAVADAPGAPGAAPVAAPGPADVAAPRACRQCSRRCERPRPAGCTHPCPLACHQGPCPRCEAQVRAGCLCGKSTLQLSCHQMVAVTATAGAGKQATVASALSCGKPCHKQLLYCTHPCNPEDCSAEVNVRCSCPAKRRAKWRCAEVQAALVKAGKPRTYDDSQAPRLLPCDAECERAKAKSSTASLAAASGSASASKGAGEDKRSGSAGATVSASPSTDNLPDAAAAVGGGKGGKARLTRAEREALAAKKEAERRRQERMSGIVRGVVLGVLGVVGVLLALGARAALLWLDAYMRDKYGKVQL
ncbi:hypothetical protein GPECTOR_1g366 [Gonium pectorale]|uniref:NF-X1-type domain-containing protein n=1 Tax=Gonium pectorale TaxID=33097 RepID=A0A150H2W1_GONPE|nr:hypothetical protein GPECTOR_1g366 [Gonium pectorale]|eukprot:KXZ56411.1 hypothetical protein GPECTOR_1g366 [Gonium pectorale]